MLYFFKSVVWWFVLMFSIGNSLFPEPVASPYYIFILMFAYVIACIMALD